MKGIIVYSLGWRHHGHSSSNVQLANIAATAIAEHVGKSEKVVVFAQRTIAPILRDAGFSCHVARKEHGYEGSEEVTRQAAEVFQRYGIREVIPIAHPFLHLTKCIRLVRKEGFATPSFWKLAQRIGWIGFDPKSVQPWTRGPIRLVFYTLRQVLFGYHPPPELSE